ncbi:hypothetical protein [Streptomyces spinosirectus]
MQPLLCPEIRGLEGLGAGPAEGTVRMAGGQLADGASLGRFAQRFRDTRLGQSDQVPDEFAGQVTVVDLFGRQRFGLRERGCGLTDVSPLRVRATSRRKRACRSAESPAGATG